MSAVLLMSHCRGKWDDWLACFARGARRVVPRPICLPQNANSITMMRSLFLAACWIGGLVAFQQPIPSRWIVSHRGNDVLTRMSNDHDPFGDFDDYSVAEDDGKWGDGWGDDFEMSSEGGQATKAREGLKKKTKSEFEMSSKGNQATKARDEAKEKPAVSHFFSKKSLKDPSFRKNKLFDLLCKGAGIERPSRIQSLAWPVLLEGKHAIVADQTGSGKTLAYLIPLLQRALASKAHDKDRRPGAPRLLVLAPTAELADQIRTVCEKLSEDVPFRTRVVTGSGAYSTSIRDQIRMLQRMPVDVLISTPGRIATILRTKNSGLDLSFLQALVLDEVDVLLIDETFGPQLRTIGVAAPVDQTQFVFVTATLPDLSKYNVSIPLLKCVLY